jgi:hypothetical protein
MNELMPEKSLERKYAENVRYTAPIIIVSEVASFLLIWNIKVYQPFETMYIRANMIV